MLNIAHFIFIYKYVANIFRSDKYVVSYAWDASRNACKSSFKLSGFNLNWDLSTNINSM